MTAPPPVPAETPGEAPAALLRRAAAKVRELADGTYCPMRWQVGRDRFRRYVEAVDSDGDTLEIVTESEIPSGEVHWIAAMSPVVAEPLAAWLVDTAAAIELRSGAFAELAPPNWATSALIFAHVLLGFPVPEPDGEGT